MNAHSPRTEPQAAVINGREVARLLGYKSENTFYNRRYELEREHGFPGKLPGLNGWSRACIIRWIETNGETYQPEPQEPRTYSALDQAAAALEHEYGGRA